MTELAQFIQQTPLMDTHEHLHKEQHFLQNGPDILQDILDNYLTADLIVAGATPEALKQALDSSNPDVAGRFRGVREAWERCQFTGYGEAARQIALQAYGIEEVTPESLAAAQEKSSQFRQPGERLRILREVANLDHVQIDDFCLPCLPDASGPEFFLYDLSWVAFCNGEVNIEEILQETGIEVRNLETLRAAIAALFARYAPCAIAVKTQHAYKRTLLWQERTDADAERVLLKVLAGNALDEAESLCLGDWSMARGVEFAIAHNLPFKIHTGYYAGHSGMPIERIKPGHLCGLLKRYPGARFVLMHIAYPYCDELVAIAKHYPNVYVDLCWAWSIDPLGARDFVRRMIHTVPSNKLFAFGGDTKWPNASAAYAVQARQWLTRALQDEVDEGLMNERQAIGLATRLMRENQMDCFDLPGTRAATREAMREPA